MTESTPKPTDPVDVPADSDPIDAEFEAADPAPVAKRSGPGWFSLLVFTLAALVGGAFGGRLLATVPWLAPPADTTPAAVADLSDAVAATQTELDTATKETIASMAGLDTRLAALETQSSDRADTLSSLTNDVEDLEDELQKVDRVASFDRRLQALETAGENADGTPASASEIALSALSQRIETLETDLAQISRRTETIEADLQDIDTAEALRPIKQGLSDLTSRIGTLTSDLEALAQAQTLAAETANTNAGATADIALSVSAVTRAAAAGEPFGGPFTRLVGLLPDDPNVAALAPIATTGAPTVDALRLQFDTLNPQAMRAIPQDGDGGLALAERLFGDQLTVRRDGEVTPEDQLAMIDAALVSGSLQAALDAAAPLPEPVRTVLAPWTDAIERRIALDAALDGLQQSLLGAPQP